MVGVSTQAAGHKTLVPELINALKELGREYVVSVSSSVRLFLVFKGRVKNTRTSDFF